MLGIKKISNYVLMVMVCITFGDCSNDEKIKVMPDVPTGVSSHTIPMKLVGSFIDFDQTKKETRASSTSWNEGDKVYITFYNTDATISGEATYNTSSGWNVSFDGELPSGTDLKCEVRHFKNTTFESSSLISLNSNSEIYEETNGNYSYVDGALIVYASLFPKTGRIRFKGEINTEIYVVGLSLYSTYSPINNTFYSSSTVVNSTVASDGFTPYIYGMLSDTERNLGVIGTDFAFTRKCSSEILKSGESGYMTIPSESSHNNWQSGLYLSVNGIGFNMIPVVGLESGFYLIGETEVTEDLCKAVDGNDNLSLTMLPADHMGYSGAKSIIEKLNNKTNLNFSLPTKEQWQYAANGGNKSLGYIYSGSNKPNEVAWYSDNCTSKQIVKTKMPNELGLYDMSGNVGEFINSNRTYALVYGGGFCSKADYIKTTSYASFDLYIEREATMAYFPVSSGYESTSKDGNSIGVGFRLILTFP